MPLWILWCIFFFKLMFSFSLAIYPGVELVGYMAVLFLVFWGTFILFSWVAASIYIPTNIEQVFPFLQIFARIFMFSGLSFRSLIHFEFIFLNIVLENVLLIISPVQLSLHHLLERLSFLHCVFLPPLL